VWLKPGLNVATSVAIRSEIFAAPSTVCCVADQVELMHYRCKRQDDLAGARVGRGTAERTKAKTLMRPASLVPELSGPQDVGAFIADGRILSGHDTALLNCSIEYW
jgi:hypothetical protein